MNRREVIKGVGLTVAAAMVPSVAVAKPVKEKITSGVVYIQIDPIDHWLIKHRVYANAATERCLGYPVIRNLAVCDAAKGDLYSAIEIVQNRAQELFAVTEYKLVHQWTPMPYRYDPRSLMEYYWTERSGQGSKVTELPG